MKMDKNDPIIGPPRGDPRFAAMFAQRQRPDANIDPIRQYLEEVYRLAPLVGIDPAIVVAQSAVETGNWGVIPGAGATAWLERNNPASTGITSNGVGEPDNDLGYEWPDGAAAARAQLAHLFAYYYADLPYWDYWNPRVDLVLDGPYAGKVRTIQDLSMTYARDKDYAAKIAARGNQIFGFTEEQPMPITFGKVPHPGYLDRPIQKPENFGQNNLGKRTPKFIALHRMIGSLWGTDTYFRMPSTGALTDYGIGVAAQDGPAQAGVIIRWNDPRGYQSGWASGSVNAPYGDGKRLVDKYGLNVVNKDGVSFEFSGISYDTPIDDVAWEEAAKLAAYWCDQMRIPWDQMPINPATGISAFVWHQEFTIGTGKICPGAVVMNHTDELIARTAQIMKPYQTGTSTGTTAAPPKPTERPKPIIPAFLGDRTKQPVVDYGGTDLVLVDDRYRALKTTGVYQRAKRDDELKLRSDLAPGTEFAIAYLFRANGELWGMSTFGSRIPLTDAERVSDAA